MKTLNYLKRNNIYYESKKKKINKSKGLELIHNYGYKIKKKVKGIYKIKDDYIKKCEYISKVEKEKLKELRGKYLDVSSTEEESLEKNNNNSNLVNSNSNSNSNSNFIFSNSNISMVKQCNKDKNHKYSLFSGISNTSRDKPIVLITYANRAKSWVIKAGRNLQLSQQLL